MYDTYMTSTAIEPALEDSLRPGAKTGPIVAILAITGIVVSLAQTLVVPIVGSLPTLFHTSTANAAWIVTVTLLSGAVSTPVVGRLADLYGKKRMLLIGVIPFIVGSVLCALAGNLATMIIGRGLQGLATGMVPLGISLLSDILPKDKAGSAIALMSSSMGIGGALGLPIAASVAQFASWRVLFWATAVVSALLLVALWKVIPVREPKSSAHGFDYLGTVGLAIGLIALLLGASKGSEWGWGSGATIGCFVIAIVVLAAWGLYELRRPAPLVDLRTTVKPVVLLTNIASILIGFAMYAMNLIIPQLMQLPVQLGYGLGQSMVQMGLWMAPMGLGMMAVSKLGASISRTKGPKVTLTLAGTVIAIGYCATALVIGTLGNRAAGDAASGTIWGTLVLLLLTTLVSGCGVGLAFGAMPALIMSAVPASEKAAANGFNSLMRSLGTTASAAIAGAVLGSMSQTVGGHAVPELGGFVMALLIGGGGALVAAFVSACIPGKPQAADPAH